MRNNGNADFAKKKSLIQAQKFAKKKLLTQAQNFTKNGFTHFYSFCFSRWKILKIARTYLDFGIS